MAPLLAWVAGVVPAAGAVANGADGRVVDVVVDSPALGREAGVRVLLPVGWEPGRSWPVLLLLHGVGDDHRSWVERTDVEGLTAGLPLIVVMPDGGRNPEAGWYSDWVGGTPAWETFHLREVLPLVAERFGGTGQVVTAGNSMGGFGALSYAARHPDLFVGAASFSGAVDTTMFGLAGATAFEGLHPYAGTPDDRVWGPYETSEVVWRGHNPADLVTNLRPVALWVRTGNGVVMPGDRAEAAPVEAGVYPMNRSLHDRLVAAGIEHAWVDRGHGTHDWPYWEADLAAVLADLAAAAVAPRAPVDRFDHRFVEDVAEVFGWRFELSGRPGPAFTELTDVGGDGLTAAGTGTLTATAPDGRSVTAALSSTPQRLVLPMPAIAAEAPAPAPPGSSPGAPAATAVRTLPATGADATTAAAAAVALAAALAAARLRRAAA